MRSSFGGRYLLNANQTVDYPLVEVEDGTITAIRSLGREEFERVPDHSDSPTPQSSLHMSISICMVVRAGTLWKRLRTPSLR
jgi:hypothetical protein